MEKNQKNNGDKTRKDEWIPLSQRLKRDAAEKLRKHEDGSEPLFDVQVSYYRKILWLM